MKTLLLLGAAGAALGLSEKETTPQPTGAPAVVQPIVKYDGETGAIVGKIMWEGDKPEPKPPLTFTDTEAEGCVHSDGPDREDRSLLISDDGGVANVVLTIDAKVDIEAPTEPIVLDQKGCRFEPHVMVIPQGATVQFANSDDTNHNIHTYTKKNQAMNQNVAGGQTLEQVMEKAEQIDVKCDVHTWMKGYIIVSDDTHFGLSGTDGSFKIEGLPPGDYKVSWWHEELGKGKTESVTVAAGGEAELVHKVSAEKKKGGGRRRGR